MRGYDVFIDTGYTMDTHTGCAMKVAVDWFEKNKKDETRMVIVSTANPAAVERCGKFFPFRVRDGILPFGFQCGHSCGGKFRVPARNFKQ